VFVACNITYLDGDKLNNKIENLRPATRSQNAYNTKIKKTNISGVKGVNWCKRDKFWIASIKVKGVSKRIGGFKEMKDAVMAMKNARIKLHGEFANHG